MSADDSLYRAVNSNDVNMVEMLINSEDFIITKEMFEWKDEVFQLCTCSNILYILTYM